MPDEPQQISKRTAHNKGKKLKRHSFEYDPSGAFRMCLACGEHNPSSSYCKPLLYLDSNQIL